MVGDKTMEINLTPEQIRNASSSKLRSYLKEDIDVDLHDMISYELFEVREAGKGEDIWN